MKLSETISGPAKVLAVLDEMKGRREGAPTKFIAAARIEHEILENALRIAYGTLLTTQNIVKDDELRAVLVGKITEIEDVFSDYR